MRIFDTHAHYDDDRFEGIREECIKESFDIGVEYILNASSDIKSSRASIALADKYPQFYAACGIHPHECCDISDKNEALDSVKSLLSHKKAVALGEIGLDYYYDTDWKEKQIEYFDSQLSLAEELSLPVIIHDRDAHGDTMDVIRAHPKSFGILHSFSGSAEMAKQLQKLGWYISFSGVVSFKNASRVIESLLAVDDERLLIETDCPYLAPVPMRGKTNRSAYLKYTIAAIANAKGVSEEEIAEMTFENAKRIFKIN
jgi:TatD DNase family protein